MQIKNEWILAEEKTVYGYMESKIKLAIIITPNQSFPGYYFLIRHSAAEQ